MRLIASIWSLFLFGSSLARQGGLENLATLREVSTFLGMFDEVVAQAEAKLDQAVAEGNSCAILVDKVMNDDPKPLRAFFKDAESISKAIADRVAESLTTTTTQRTINILGRRGLDETSYPYGVESDGDLAAMVGSGGVVKRGPVKKGPLGGVGHKGPMGGVGRKGPLGGVGHKGPLGGVVNKEFLGNSKGLLGGHKDPFVEKKSIIGSIRKLMGNGILGGQRQREPMFDWEWDWMDRNVQDAPSRQLSGRLTRDNPIVGGEGVLGDGLSHDNVLRQGRLGDRQTHKPFFGGEGILGDLPTGKPIFGGDGVLGDRPPILGGHTHTRNLGYGGDGLLGELPTPGPIFGGEGILSDLPTHKPIFSGDGVLSERPTHESILGGEGILGDRSARDLVLGGDGILGDRDPILGGRMRGLTFGGPTPPPTLPPTPPPTQPPTRNPIFGGDGILCDLPTHKPIFSGDGVLSERPTREPIFDGEGILSELPTHKPVFSGDGALGERPTRDPIFRGEGILSELPTHKPVFSGDGVLGERPTRDPIFDGEGILNERGVHRKDE